MRRSVKIGSETGGREPSSWHLEREFKQQLMLLVDASSALLASPHTEDVLRKIIELAQRFGAADGHAVWRKQASEDEWTLVWSAGLSPGFVGTASGPLHSKDPIFIENVGDDARFGRRREALMREGVRSILIVPLHVHGMPTATMVFFWRGRHRFANSEMRIAAALGNMAAAALGAADIYERERALREEGELVQQRTAFLAEAGAVLAGSLDYATTLRSVAKLAVQAFADWCAIDVLRNGELERVTLEHVDPAKVELARKFREKYPPTEDDATRVAMRTGQPILASYITDEMLAESVRDPEQLQMMQAMGIHAVMIAPMVNRERTLGLLTFVSSKRNRRYSEADFSLAQELARRAATAIDNAGLYAEARANLEREQEARYTAQLLNRVGQILSAELDAKALTQSVTDIAMQLVNAEFGAFFFNQVNEQGESYTLYALSGASYEAFANFPPPRNTDLFGPTFREGVVRIDDVTEDAGYRKNAPYFVMPEGHLPVRSYLAAPVTSRSGEVMGGLYFGHSQPRVFQEQAEVFLTGIASQAAIALDNARLFSESRQAQDALRRSNEELRRVNEDLNHFAYSASHDLQEPLRMVSAYTQLLQKRYGTKLDEEADKYIGFAVGGAQRMEAPAAGHFGVYPRGGERCRRREATGCGGSARQGACEPERRSGRQRGESERRRAACGEGGGGAPGAASSEPDWQLDQIRARYGA